MAGYFVWNQQGAVLAPKVSVVVEQEPIDEEVLPEDDTVDVDVEDSEEWDDTVDEGADEIETTPTPPTEDAEPEEETFDPDDYEEESIEEIISLLEGLIEEQEGE